MKGKDIKKKFEQKIKTPDKILTYNILLKRDHYMYELFYKNKYIGLFKISMGSKEFGKALIGIMSRQLGISSNQLRGIVNCTFWAKDFISYSRLLQKDMY